MFTRGYSPIHSLTMAFPRYMYRYQQPRPQAQKSGHPPQPPFSVISNSCRDEYRVDFPDFNLTLIENNESETDDESNYDSHDCYDEDDLCDDEYPWDGYPYQPPSQDNTSGSISSYPSPLHRHIVKGYRHSCPLCSEANRPNQHHIGDCPYLPEEDKCYVTKARHFAKIFGCDDDFRGDNLSDIDDGNDIPASVAGLSLSEAGLDLCNAGHDRLSSTLGFVVDSSESDESPQYVEGAFGNSGNSSGSDGFHGMNSVPCSPTMANPSVLPDQANQCPRVDFCYLDQHVQVAFVSGSTQNLIRYSTVSRLGGRITATLPAGDSSSLGIVGETALVFSHAGKEFLFTGFVVGSLDVDVQAGTPFMELHDVTVRPARRQICFGDGPAFTYGNSLTDNTCVSCAVCETPALKREFAKVALTPELTGEDIPDIGAAVVDPLLCCQNPSTLADVTDNHAVVTHISDMCLQDCTSTHPCDMEMVHCPHCRPDASSPEVNIASAPAGRHTYPETNDAHPVHPSGAELSTCVAIAATLAVPNCHPCDERAEPPPGRPPDADLSTPVDAAPSPVEQAQPFPDERAGPPPGRPPAAELCTPVNSSTSLADHGWTFPDKRADPPPGRPPDTCMLIFACDIASTLGSRPCHPCGLKGMPHPSRPPDAFEQLNRITISYDSEPPPTPTSCERHFNVQGIVSSSVAMFAADL